MSETRIPTQKRSIEKRNKIIEKGFELMCKKGYHKTNTSEIAEYTGVSTGIIYQYFTDKKEIFIEGIKQYSDNIMFPVLKLINNTEIKIDNLENLLNEIIKELIKSHTISYASHEEMMAMSHLDEATAQIFYQKELEVTNRIVEILKYNNFNSENLYEKVHIIMGLMDNLCHEIVYHKHNSINYENMKKEVINIIVNTLKKD